MDLIRGTCPIPNWILDRLMCVVTGEELKIVMFVARRTRGFQREAARVTARQMVEGTRAEDGRALDGGAGVGRASVKTNLVGLKRLRVLVEVSPNNALNEGPEYRLALEEEVDWEALEARKTATAARVAERLDRARREKRGGLSNNPPPRSDGQTVPPVYPIDHPLVYSADHPPVCGTDDPLVYPIDHPHERKENQRETQVENQEAEVGDSAECRRRLEEIGVSETLITYLCRDPERRYWAIQWATWWPCRATEIGAAQINRFIRNRVVGACAGREEDRQPPAEWFDFAAERAKAEARKAAEQQREEKRQKEQAPPVEFGDGAEALYLALRGALDKIDRGHLAAAHSATVEDGGLVVRFRGGANQEWLGRRKTSILRRVRESIPSFPDVRFELVREGGRG